jgi:hypothetical protein
VHEVAAAEDDRLPRQRRARDEFLDAPADHLLRDLQVPIRLGLFPPGKHADMPVIAGKEVEQVLLDLGGRRSRNGAVGVLLERGLDRRDDVLRGVFVAGLHPLLNGPAVRVNECRDAFDRVARRDREIPAGLRPLLDCPTARPVGDARDPEARHRRRRVEEHPSLRGDLDAMIQRLAIYAELPRGGADVVAGEDVCVRGLPRLLVAQWLRGHLADPPFQLAEQSGPDDRDDRGYDGRYAKRSLLPSFDLDDARPHQADVLLDFRHVDLKLADVDACRVRHVRILRDQVRETRDLRPQGADREGHFV